MDDFEALFQDKKLLIRETEVMLAKDLALLFKISISELNTYARLSPAWAKATGEANKKKFRFKLTREEAKTNNVLSRNNLAPWVYSRIGCDVFLHYYSRKIMKMKVPKEIKNWVNEVNLMAK